VRECGRAEAIFSFSNDITNDCLPQEPTDVRVTQAEAASNLDRVGVSALSQCEHPRSCSRERENEFLVDATRSRSGARPMAHTSITIGTMTAGNIAQASPGAKQSVEFNLNIEATEKALTAFEAALASASLPS
jgi:hypothetical protein